MKLHADRLPALNTVTAYGEGYVEINRERHQAPLRLMPEGSVERWEVGGFDELSAEDIAALLELGPELVLIGTGEQQRFLHPSRSEEHTSELQSRENLVCRLL